MAPSRDSHKEDDSWIDEYNAAMSRKPAGPPKMPAVPSCAVFGALFLFVIAGLMRSKYRYIHIPGDLDALSKPVTYAGFAYLAFAAISLCCWSRASNAQKVWKERLAAQLEGRDVDDSDVKELNLGR